jgi:RNA polymerase sigma-70 factor, ECF subfamily
MTTHAAELLSDPAAQTPPGFLAWVGQLVHAHRAQLFAYARRRGLGAEDALDVVQDGFVQFLKLPQARAIANAPDDAIKLLTVLVRHDVMNRRRKQARRARAELLLESAGTTETECNDVLVARAEELTRINGCILRMAELQRRVVMLSLLDEHPKERVAALLGISQGYVRVLLHRARESIRTCPFE